MTPMVIGPAEIEALRSLAQYAEKHPLSVDDLLDQMNGDRPAPGLMAEYQRIIPIGFKVVFTIEKASNGQYCRHLSISCSTRGRVPYPAAVIGIMKLLGFENELQDCLVKIENIEDGEHAINVGELIALRNGS